MQTRIIAAALVIGLLIYLAVFKLWGGGPTMSRNHPFQGTTETGNTTADATPDGLEKATFASGCFWCTEAFFQQLKGVHSVVSGYSGGQTKDPTYEEVCSGTTGYAEAIQITYDPKIVTYPELLEVFWQTHDPTTLNRQGNDVGTQYRSAVFYHNEQQKKDAEHYKAELDASGAFSRPIVTEITAFTNFVPAERYHQNYYVDNPAQPYCSVVIRPKVEKFKKVFHDKLKSPAS